MLEKSIMIVNAVLDPNEKEAFALYSERSGPLFKNVGAKPISKYKVAQNIVGDKKLQVVAIMEFPSKKAILDVFESEAYKELLPLRAKAFTELEVFIGKE
ncbi:DUF1330 domain-containing protein [Kordia sp. YSTF-M3]|uniref:DUF1330 domain-containing protein n=1 Tax=Kordia aestuariivivens TaxID=2759037 RepID=A0ABR7QBU0_9FLAO|nr:DUF1330 domain-containing protein [Kordia aestuariivivens]MBC8755953.1 DUF1330 domain-containing protein [Kordia aestuariivivens]